MAFRLNRSEPGFAVSAIAHAALLAAGLFAYASPRFPEAEEGIPVEIITENQFSQITRGEKTAKEVKETPKPRVDRVAETVQERDPGEAPRDTPAPPRRPAEVKADEQELEAAASPAPPPPPPAPRIEAKPELKPEPKREDLAKLVEKAEAEQLAHKAAEEKAKAEAEARAKAEADAKAKAEAEARAKAKALADAKAKAEADAKAKALAEAKAKQEAEAKAKKQAELADKLDLGDIRQLLQSKEKAQSSGNTGSEVQKTASLGTAAGTAPRLNPSMLDGLRGLVSDQLRKCWDAPIAAQSAPNPPVPTIRIRVNPDGSLAGEPAVVNTSSDPLFRSVADSAMRATRRCSPLRIPAQFAPYYEDWKSIVVNFDPRDT